MLPGTYRLWTPDADRIAGEETADKVRYQAIGGPISTPNYVPCTPSGYATLMITDLVDREVTLSISSGHNLRTRLGAGVGIVTPKSVGFPVSPEPFFILVTLVCGYTYHCSNAWRAANRVQNARCANDVRFKGTDWILIGVADQRLRRHVQDDIGRKLRDGCIQFHPITDIASNIFDQIADFRGSKKIWICAWI